MLNFARYYNHLVLYKYTSAPNNSTIVHQSADTWQLIAELIWHLAFCWVSDRRLACVSPNNPNLADKVQLFLNNY